jgi:hypothetical protein
MTLRYLSTTSGESGSGWKLSVCFIHVSSSRCVRKRTRSEMVVCRRPSFTHVWEILPGVRAARFLASGCADDGLNSALQDVAQLQRLDEVAGQTRQTRSGGE